MRRHPGRARAGGPVLTSALVALATALAPVVAGAQAPPPDDRWLTLRTEHFRVTFADGLEELARPAAAAAEAAYGILSAELEQPPAGTIDILITDHVDFSNGFANIFPSNRITLFARPPTDMRSLQFTRGWMEMVVVHELTHVFHLDATGAIGDAIRTVFGRLPLLWPTYPAVATPTWSIEGLATYYESRLTGAGRVHGSYHDMVVRTTVLEDRVMAVGELKPYNPTWPGGDRPYIFGSLFMDYLSERFGPDVHEALLEGTTAAWIPPFLWFDRTAGRGTGAGFRALYRDWIASLEEEYGALADSLRALGVTESEALVAAGPYAVQPRVSPDGRAVSYAAADYRDVNQTRVLDVETGVASALARRNQVSSGLGPASWLPDGQSMVLAQLDFTDRYDLFQDLYVLDLRGNERRLTRGARMAQPDVAPDGRRVAAVQTVDGATRVVLYDLADGRIMPLTRRDPAVSWSLPRWSPDGQRIAVGRWAEGGDYDIVLLEPGDDGTATLRTLMQDQAIDAAPAWSPDGRWILHSSDRSGIPNLYATEVETGRLRQVTSVLTGAFDPDVSPDGRWIYFVRFHTDGFHLERIPFDTAAWRDPAPLRLEFQRGLITTNSRDDSVIGAHGRTGESGAAQTGVMRPVRPYSALPTLLPRYWSPWFFGDSDELFFGAYTSGEDLVGRHRYTLAGAYQPEHGFWAGLGSYTWAGLGNPVINMFLSRDWGRWPGEVFLTDSSLAVPYSREDRVELSVGFLHRRWRASAGLALGGELYDIDYVVPGRSRNELPYIDPPRTAGLFVRPSLATTRSQPYSIAPENGIAGSLTLRTRWPLEDAGGSFERGYDEARGNLATYLALPLPGFANHVLITRGEFAARFGVAAVPYAIGGADTGSNLFGIGLGSSPTLPVRGFQHGDRSGNRAWVASIEYRVPLMLKDPANKRSFTDFDRLHGALFLDAGDAWCVGTRFVGSPSCTTADEPRLAAYGAELSVELGILANAFLALRGGVAVPVVGRTSRPTLYIRVGGTL